VKKNFAFLLFWLTTITSSFALSDSLTIPKIDFWGNKVFTGFRKTIENPTSKPIEFCFCDFPQTDSQFLADYILNKITDPLDTPKAQLQIVLATAHFLKSPKYYINNNLIFSGQWNDESLFAKEHSLIGRIFSTTSTQCGNNSEQARIICLATGFFKPADFHHISIANHAFIETKIGCDFAFTDYDAGSCVFMVHNPNSPNGWASYLDIKQDTSLIIEKYLEDGIDYHKEQTLSNYRLSMSANTYNMGVFPWSKTEIIDGKFIIPPYSQLVFELNDMIHFIDTIAPDICDLYHGMMNMIQAFEIAKDTGVCYPCIDTFQRNLSMMYGGDTVLINDYLNKGNICFYNSTLDYGKKISTLFNYIPDLDSTPCVILRIDTTNKPLHIGQDLKMPLFVLEADSSMLVGDTLITQKAIFPLWVTGTEPSLLSYKEVNYLTNGILYPSDKPKQLKLSWNSNILGQFAKWNVCSNSIDLNLSDHVSAVTPTITPTDLPTQPSAIETNISIFPNPASHQVNLLGIKHAIPIHVFNASGAKVISTVGTSFNCSHLPNGTYFVYIFLNNKPITKKLIVAH